MERARNHSRDLWSYHFEWIEEAWAKHPGWWRFIVRATNPEGREIEVSILCDDSKHGAENIIGSIFNRWLQENDFKYLLKIISRNIFYEMLEPFKKAYDNYRDDHLWYRHLTQSTTGIMEADEEVRCIGVKDSNFKNSHKHT